MRLGNRTRVLTMICVMLAAAGSPRDAIAQASDQASPLQSPPRLYATPFVAMGDDLAPGGGAALTFAWMGPLSIEAEASLGTDAARSSLSLIYSTPRWGRFGPYVAGGAGVQRDESESLVPGFVTPKKTEFAVNIGGGMSVPVTDRWQYRVDFRWYNPDHEWPESWRVYSGITFGLRSDGRR